MQTILMILPTLLSGLLLVNMCQPVRLVGRHIFPGCHDTPYHDRPSHAISSHAIIYHLNLLPSSARRRLIIAGNIVLEFDIADAWLRFTSAGAPYFRKLGPMQPTARSRHYMMIAMSDGQISVMGVAYSSREYAQQQLPRQAHGGCRRL